MSAVFYAITALRIGSHADFLKKIDYTHVNFAGEKVTFEGKYYYHREKFDRELLLLSYNLPQFILYLKREKLFLPIIEKKLRAAQIPDDFKYLAIAESALRNDALSSASAGGIWQFIPDTARRFGLRVDSVIDERYNFELETDAAIAYLSKLYNDFKNWTLVAASYNRWETGIRNALDDQHASSYYDLYLNEETSRYVFRILAIKYAFLMRDMIVSPDEVGSIYEDPIVNEISVWPIKSLKQWALDNGFMYQDIKRLNVWILGDSLPEGTWKIKVPKKS